MKSSIKHVKMILPALTEATSPYWRPIKYSLFPPLGLATLAAYLDPDVEISFNDTDTWCQTRLSSHEAVPIIARSVTRTGSSPAGARSTHSLWTMRWLKLLAFPAGIFTFWTITFSGIK